MGYRPPASSLTQRHPCAARQLEWTVHRRNHGLIAGNVELRDGRTGRADDGCDGLTDRGEVVGKAAQDFPPQLSHQMLASGAVFERTLVLGLEGGENGLALDRTLAPGEHIGPVIGPVILPVILPVIYGDAVGGHGQPGAVAAAQPGLELPPLARRPALPHATLPPRSALPLHD